MPLTDLFLSIAFAWFSLARSYLVTSTNAELTRIREEQERTEEEEAEAEMDSVWEKFQRRPPLADLSEKTTGMRQHCSFSLRATVLTMFSSETANARSLTTNQPAPRVPPLKIKLSGPEKAVKPPVVTAPLNTKYHCDLKLSRVDLSAYDISNLPKAPVIDSAVTNKSSTSSTTVKMKPKPLVGTKPFEHLKPLKRLNTLVPKKSSPSSSSSSSPTDPPRPKQHSTSSSIRSISTENSSSSSVLKSKAPPTPIVAERTSPTTPAVQTKASEPMAKPAQQSTTLKKEKRPALPSEYRCSIPVSRIDLILYNLPMPLQKTLPTVIKTTAPGTLPQCERRFWSLVLIGRTSVSAENIRATNGTDKCISHNEYSTR